MAAQTANLARTHIDHLVATNQGLRPGRRQVCGRGRRRDAVADPSLCREGTSIAGPGLPNVALLLLVCQTPPSCLE